jgi:hypothetical protein
MVFRNDNKIKKLAVTKLKLVQTFGNNKKLKKNNKSTYPLSLVSPFFFAIKFTRKNEAHISTNKMTNLTQTKIVFCRFIKGKFLKKNIKITAIAIME